MGYEKVIFTSDYTRSVNCFIFSGRQHVFHFIKSTFNATKDFSVLFVATHGFFRGSKDPFLLVKATVD